MPCWHAAYLLSPDRLPATASVAPDQVRSHSARRPVFDYCGCDGSLSFFLRSKF